MGFYVPVACRRTDALATAAKPRKSACKGDQRLLLTDAQILELRALSQFAGWCRERLMERYGINADAANRYLMGISRARLVAKPEHLPPEERQ